jgi:hypothetical protein
METKMTDLVTRLRTAPVDNRPATLLNEAADRIEALQKYIAKLENDGFKYRKALVEIQMKAHDTLRPIPFQEEDDE